MVTYIIKGKPTIGPTHSIPSYLTQKIRNHMFKQRPVHNIYRSFLWVSQNLENRILKDKLIKKFWHIHTAKSTEQLQEMYH